MKKISPVILQVAIENSQGKTLPSFLSPSASMVLPMRDVFPDVVVGLSDHESGTAMTLVAYMLGARVIEKHFTLNRAWRGTDHAFSLSSNGLKQLVRNLRRSKLALGDGIKRKLPVEVKPLLKMSKKIVASKHLAMGHVLGNEDVCLKSPGDGLPPFELKNLIGKKLVKEVQKDDSITYECFQ